MIRMKRKLNIEPLSTGLAALLALLIYSVYVVAQYQSPQVFANLFSLMMSTFAIALVPYLVYKLQKWNSFDKHMPPNETLWLISIMMYTTAYNSSIIRYGTVNSVYLGIAASIVAVVISTLTNFVLDKVVIVSNQEVKSTNGR